MRELIERRLAKRRLAKRRLAKRLGLTAVQLYLQRWGLTPRKPLVRAKERQPAASHRGLAADHLPGDRQAGQSGAGGDLPG